MCCLVGSVILLAFHLKKYFSIYKKQYVGSGVSRAEIYGAPRGMDCHLGINVAGS